jgi:hypothetical protein
MPKKTTSDFIPEDPIPKGTSIKKTQFQGNTFLYPIDETDDFYDPFSDLSLFLANKIKNELIKENNPKQWSKKIQDILLKQILPEFNHKFPKYRLGIAALKKTWEKVRFYLDSIDEKKGALLSDGSLNIPFMIRENLKEFLLKKSKTTPFPYHQAHGLAVKISECIATLDGARNSLDDLTKTIWSLQKHLIIPGDEYHKCPYEKYDAIDKLIVRFQLEELSRDHLLSQKDLAQNVQKKLMRLSGLCRIRHIEDLTPGLWALLADKLYPHLTIHKTLHKEKLSSIESFIQNECHQFMEENSDLEEKDRIHLVRRVLLLYRLASKITIPQAEQQLQAAISYVLSLSSDRIRTEIPVLRPEVYAFINYEVGLVKNQRNENPLEKVLQTLIRTFEQAKNLPILSDKEYGELEIIIWKTIHEEYNLLAKVPYYLRDLIEEELISVHIEHPEINPQNLIHQILGNLKQIRNLPISQNEPLNPLSSEDSNDHPIAKKVYCWSLQGDLISGWLHFNMTTPVCKTIKKLWKQTGLTEGDVCHSDFIQKTLEKLVHEFPFFASYTHSIKSRITIMYKYFWYTELRSDQETSFDRFIKWHYIELANEKQMQFHEMIIEHLNDICNSSLPLLPFNREYVRSQTEAIESSVASSS